MGALGGVVYLCGAINGCSDSECRDWREEAKRQLLPLRCLDPMARDYRGKESHSFQEIVTGDLLDIDQSQAMLVQAARPSWGTAMEVFYAYRQGLLVVVVAPPEAPVSPWLRYHSHAIVHGLTEACEVIRERLGQT